MASTFNVNDFRSNIKSGYHRAAHFDMEIGVPLGLRTNLAGSAQADFRTTSQNLHFDIEAANIPGVAFGTDENRRYGMGPFNLKPYVPIFDTVNLTARSDSSGQIYDFFQSWMKLIINFDVSRGIDGAIVDGLGSGQFGGVASGYEVAYKRDYATAARISVYDEAGGDASIMIDLIDAFPIHLGNASLDWADSRILKFPVTMTFASWTSLNGIRAANTSVISTT